MWDTETKIGGIYESKIGKEAIRKSAEVLDGGECLHWLGSPTNVRISAASNSVLY